MQSSVASTVLSLPKCPSSMKEDQNHEKAENSVLQVATFCCQSSTQDQLSTSSSLSLDGLSIEHVEKVNQVTAIVQNLKEPSERLVMIDDLRRLGIEYHFQEEIESLLCGLCENYGALSSLYDVALSFRLLREHGHNVSQDVFKRFMDEEGRFKLQLSTDIKGMMSLYEASKLAVKGEDIIEEANDFATKNLIASVKFMEPCLARVVRHSLENPFHMSLPRFNTKNHLNNLRETDRNTEAIQELAIFEFNIVQSMHQSELKEVTQWWRDLGLSQELRFARDQPLKWYMWSLAVLPNPKFSKYRIELTKPIALVYIIDDIYDVYGKPDELVLFTEAINRWDPSDISQLPTYMKICFMALHGVTNELAYMVLKEHGWNPINSLRQKWRDLCNAFLVEAKWFAEGDLPKADEYLRNGVTSSGVAAVLVHLFFLVGHGITRESVDLDENQDGYDGSYLECYMKENVASLESTQRHVRHLISNAWKELNKESLSPYPFSQTFVQASLNTARMVQVMYSYNKDQRLPMLEQHIISLLKERIPLDEIPKKAQR
ncbi:S-+-linalool synthase [Cinnamomum micranthum f. kanehirae]|uniref:S-+-linalool synthase n=1 Tax=Cinnamomum micranthum f. kanehirae TaxID=337451 RepID=A0A443PRY4_9MAGN|nr:S-+-linalool synthase [Cinnamomum micranthum f. kanehirae]